MYAKYRVAAFDENKREIEAQVFDGIPDEVTAEMIAHLADQGIVASSLELDIVTYEMPHIR